MDPLSPGTYIRRAIADVREKLEQLRAKPDADRRLVAAFEHELRIYEGELELLELRARRRERQDR